MDICRRQYPDAEALTESREVSCWLYKEHETKEAGRV
jgi:hypothetical protein